MNAITKIAVFFLLTVTPKMRPRTYKERAVPEGAARSLA